MEQLNLFEIEPVEIEQPKIEPAEQPEKTEPVKADPEIEEKEPEEIQPAKLKRPIWQAKRVKSLKECWNQSNDWFRPGREYDSFQHYFRHGQLVKFGSADGLVVINDYKYLYGNDAFFLEHFEILEWDEEVAG